MSEWSLIKTSDMREINDLASEIRGTHDLQMISQKAAKIKALCSCVFPCNVKPEGTE